MRLESLGRPSAPVARNLFEEYCFGSSSDSEPRPASARGLAHLHASICETDACGGTAPHRWHENQR